MAISLDSSARATVDLLDAIKDSSATTDQKKEAINIAHQIVEQNLASVLSDSTLLEKIETQLAADVLSNGVDPQETSASVGQMQASFALPGEDTGYWRMAKRLDSSGTLAGLEENDEQVCVTTISGGADN